MHFRLCRCTDGPRLLRTWTSCRKSLSQKTSLLNMTDLTRWRWSPASCQYSTKDSSEARIIYIFLYCYCQGFSGHFLTFLVTFLFLYPFKQNVCGTSWNILCYEQTFVTIKTLYKEFCVFQCLICYMSLCKRQYRWL